MKACFQMVDEKTKRTLRSKVFVYYLQYWIKGISEQSELLPIPPQSIRIQTLPDGFFCINYPYKIYDQFSLNRKLLIR